MECNWKAKAPMGVCPDSFLGGDNADLNNVQLVWGQRVDGKTRILGFREQGSSPVGWSSVQASRSFGHTALWSLRTTISTTR